MSNSSSSESDGQIGRKECTLKIVSLDPYLLFKQVKLAKTQMKAQQEINDGIRNSSTFRKYQNIYTSIYK